MRRTVCLVCIFLAAQLLASMVVMFFFNLPGLLRDGRLDLDVVASPGALGISLVLSAALVWAVMTLLRWTDRKSFRSGGYGWAVYGTLVLWMVPVIFLVNLLLEAFALEDLNEETFLRMAYDPWGILALVVAGPFSEELVFRMGIQRHLMRHRMRPWVAIALTGLIFGVIHGNPAQIPGAVLFGFVLGWLYWRSGTIWTSVAAHVFNNFVGVALIWCTGDARYTLVELCGGVWAAVLWAVVALPLVYVGVRSLDRMFVTPLDGKGTGSAGVRL